MRKNKNRGISRKHAALLRGIRAPLSEGPEPEDVERALACEWKKAQSDMTSGQRYSWPQLAYRMYTELIARTEALDLAGKNPREELVRAVREGSIDSLPIGRRTPSTPEDLPQVKRLPNWPAKDLAVAAFLHRRLGLTVEEVALLRDECMAERRREEAEHAVRLETNIETARESERHLLSSECGPSRDRIVVLEAQVEFDRSVEWRERSPIAIRDFIYRWRGLWDRAESDSAEITISAYLLR